jgi:catecholate siderophore receptor
MHANHRSRLTLALLAVAPCAAVAQDLSPAATDAIELDRIVVTGRAGVEIRRKVETSYAITTLSEEELRMDAPLGVADALKSVPGFWTEPSGGEASANIRVRGIPQEGFSSVGLLEDGLPIQHDAGLGWLNADQSFRLDETIESIEVVRGGPASIFSSNSPGGVVNFITRRGGDTPGGLVKVEVSDYGRLRGDFWYGAPAGDWRFGVGGFYRQDDGIRDPGYAANEGGQVRLSLGRDFDGGTIDFNLKRIDDNVIFYTGLPLTNDDDGDIVGVPGIDANDGTLSGPETRRVRLLDANGPFVLDVDRGTDVELTQFTAKLDWRFGDGWRLDNGLRYRESETARIGLFPNTPTPASTRLDAVRPAALAAFPGAVDVQYRYVNAPGEAFDVAAQNGNGLIVDGALREVSVPLDEWINDFRIARRFEFGEQAHDLAFGVYLAQVDETFTRYSANALLDVRDNARLLDIVAVDAAGNVVGSLTDDGISRYGSEYANGTGESFTSALYASDEWEIGERFRLDLGARYERVDVEGRVEQFAGRNLGISPTPADDNVLSGTGVFDGFDESFDDFGWTLGANWQFDDVSGVFARYTSTFRLPSVGTYITNATAIPLTQDMDFIEAGYKFSTPGLQFYATAFHTRFDSFAFGELVFNPDTGGFDSRTVLTDTKTTGLELEGQWLPNEWFDLRFAGTWQDPRFGHLTNSRIVDGELVVDDYTDNQLIRVPRNSLRLVPAVNLLGRKLRVELDVERYGDRYSDAANSVVLPDYTVLNVNARYDFTPDVSLYLYADNLTDEVGLTEGNPRAGQFQSGEADSPFFVGRPIFGRNYRAALLWRF